MPCTGRRLETTRPPEQHHVPAAQLRLDRLVAQVAAQGCRRGADRWQEAAVSRQSGCRRPTHAGSACGPTCMQAWAWYSIQPHGPAPAPTPLSCRATEEWEAHLPHTTCSSDSSRGPAAPLPAWPGRRGLQEQGGPRAGGDDKGHKQSQTAQASPVAAKARHRGSAGTTASGFEASRFW